MAVITWTGFLLCKILPLSFRAADHIADAMSSAVSAPAAVTPSSDRLCSWIANQNKLFFLHKLLWSEHFTTATEGKLRHTHFVWTILSLPFSGMSYSSGQIIFITCSDVLLVENVQERKTQIEMDSETSGCHLFGGRFVIGIISFEHIPMHLYLFSSVM